MLKLLLTNAHVCPIEWANLSSRGIPEPEVRQPSPQAEIISNPITLNLVHRMLFQTELLTRLILTFPPISPHFSLQPLGPFSVFFPFATSTHPVASTSGHLWAYDKELPEIDYEYLSTFSPINESRKSHWIHPAIILDWIAFPTDTTRCAGLSN